jgi:hypothetical protein
MKFKKVEEDIIPILKSNKSARCDDMILYADYAYRKIAGLGYGSEWLQKIFSDRRFRAIHGIATFETVSRCRRKIQETRDDLKASADMIEEKKRQEKEYRDYARGLVKE